MIADPGLFEAFEKDSWTAKYEDDLSRTIRYHVNKAVQTYLHRASPPATGSDEDSPAEDTIIYKRPVTDADLVQHRGRQNSSADVTDEDPVFEHFPKNPELSLPHQIRSRHYSSSPTTSFSTDLTEGKQTSTVNGKARIEVEVHGESKCKTAVVWSDEEQDLLAKLVKTQRSLENFAELKADPFWKLITSQLVANGFNRGVPSVRSYWHTRGRAKYKFEERTNPRKRRGGEFANLSLPSRRLNYSGASTSASSTPKLPTSTQLLERLESFDIPSSSQPAPRRAPNATRAHLVPRQVQALEPDRPRVKALRRLQAQRLAALDTTIRRPYLSSVDRDNIRRGLDLMLNGRDQMLSIEELRQLQGSVLHVDFSPEEMNFVCESIRAVKGGNNSLNDDSSQQTMALMKHEEANIDRICRLIQTNIKNSARKVAQSLLQVRSEMDVRAFLEDAAAGSLSSTPSFLGLDLTPLPKQPPSTSSVSSLLRERETWGMAPFRARGCRQSFGVEFSNHLEDSLVLQSEWTDCCGDISDVSWTGDCAFICGATAHSDFHNMQYNKPGNLLVGSVTLDTLRSIPDHRIERPIIGREENAENALESMRQTQDSWLYTSVVSTAHSEASGYTFTASFDGNVKVWKVSDDGSSMVLHGNWAHEGKVNFVKTSEHHERIATASHVSSRAIRVYDFDESSIPGSPFDSYDCERALAQAQEVKRTDTWAYFPATIAWGRFRSVEMLLLVGYSPRSLTEHENDIPEEKRNSGELCLWNVENGEPVLISSSKCQNVFEVMWHPTQPIFLAATSPSGIYDTQTKTQIRLFGQHELTGTFMQIKVLDCEASDINELTVM